MSALRAALRKAVAPQGPSRRSFATSSPGPKPAEGEAPPEKVGFFVATAGLVGASLGAVAVFVVGVAGVLGAAKAVGAILGALPRSARKRRAFSLFLACAGHSLDNKRAAEEKTKPAS